MLDCNLEYYRSFFYVARLGNMTKAAEALFLSQPAVTHSIQKLEEYLETSLFKRTSKGMVLTFEGEVLYKNVSSAFDLLIQGEREVKNSTLNPSGIIRIAATETPLYKLLVPKIASFKLEYPNAFVEITGSNSKESINLLRNNKVDLSLLVSPINKYKDLDTTIISSFEDVIICGEKYKELTNKILTLNDLISYPLVTVEKGTSARCALDSFFQENGILFEPTYSVRTSTLVLPFVKEDLAIGIIPTSFIEGEQNLYKINLNCSIPKRNILIANLKGVPLSPLCKCFLDHLVT